MLLFVNNVINWIGNEAFKTIYASRARKGGVGFFHQIRYPTLTVLELWRKRHKFIVNILNVVQMVLTEEDVRQVSSILSALGNPTRFRIVELVTETKRPLHIKAVAQMLKKDYAAVYRHVKVLQKSGLLGIYEVGRSRVLYPKNADLMQQFVQFAKKSIRKK